MKVEVRKEIVNIAPNVSQIGNQNPYTVPSGYFNSLTGAVSKKVCEPDIPEGYFDTLPDAVLQKAKSQSNNTPAKTASVVSINFKKWVAAASIIIMGIVSYTAISTGESNPQYTNELDLEEALDFLVSEGNLTLYDVYDLTENIDGDIVIDETLDADNIDQWLDAIPIDELDDLY